MSLTRHPISVEAVLSGDACRARIMQAEQGAWRTSGIDESNPTRWVTAAQLDPEPVFNAVRPALPASLFGMPILRVASERSVYLRYQPGECFDLHSDHPFQPNQLSRSLFSLIIYLNDDFVGGATHFPDLQRTIRPRTGMALLIPHGLRHRGRVLESGTKYALHSYLIYGWQRDAVAPIPLGAK